ncbi:MAG TPA: lipoprotein [Gammaproteobacteria bacterium]|nr:lipoprotein [Gammaproteobacteria bacterium]
MTFRITKISRRLVLALFLASLLAACGQKGDLYHPEEEEAAAATSRLTA